MLARKPHSQSVHGLHYLLDIKDMWLGKKKGEGEGERQAKAEAKAEA